jgi:hypothetical protein
MKGSCYGLLQPLVCIAKHINNLFSYLPAATCGHSPSICICFMREKIVCSLLPTCFHLDKD